MTYLAPWVTLVVVLNHFLCFVQINGEKAGKWGNVPWFFHAYWLQYICLGLLIMKEIKDMIANVMIPTHWLDSPSTDAYVQCQMINEHECYVDPSMANQTCDIDGSLSFASQCDHPSFLAWHNETDMSGSVMFPCVRVFSLTAPLWLLGTFVVCVYHTYGHSRRMREGGLWNNPTRRMIIAVILLPLVWGLMSFCSVMRAWQLLVDHVQITGGCGGRASDTRIFHGYEERKRFLLEMYQVNFDVAGVYQAVSMFIFAEIITSLVLVKAEKLKNAEKLKKKDNALDDDSVQSKQSSSLMDQFDAYHTVAQLTMEGVLLFSAQSFVKGLFSLFITTMAFDFCGVGDRFFSFSVTHPGLFQKPRVKDEIQMLFKGVSLVASYNAMRHIGTLQNKKNLLEGGFNSDFKCKMIKLLTSLESVQPFAFMLLWEVSHEIFGLPKLGFLRNNLFIASLMCMETFFISIGNLKAWNIEEQWIDDFPAEFNEEIVATMNDPFSEVDKEIKSKWQEFREGKRKIVPSAQQRLLDDVTQDIKSGP